MPYNPKKEKNILNHISGYSDLKTLFKDANEIGFYNNTTSGQKIRDALTDNNTGIYRRVYREMRERYTFYPVNLTAYPSLAFKGSKIIDGRLDYFIQDGKGHGWLCDTEPKLIYRSNDSKFSSGFHRCCDDKGSTLIIAKTKEGYIFGGATSQSWKKTERPGNLFLFLSSIYRQTL